MPHEITKLANLTSLDLSKNELRTLPSEITKLTNLTSLDLSDNGLTTLPREITNLTKLTSLDLSGNWLHRLGEITNLTNLTSLALSDNGLTTLPREITNLTKLTSLDLSGNQLATLLSEITKLTNLTSLDLSNNGLTTLPREITDLTKLTSLRLSKNELRTLPSEITKLTNLTSLTLSSNQLKMLPSAITKLTSLTSLDLSDNPLPISPELLKSTYKPVEILHVLAQLSAGERKPLHEAKLIIVGEGSVGKTSLVRRLLDGEYDPYEDKTKGIEIRKWKLPLSDAEIQLNVWDFGGQEIMHATHQFFMTKRSLYVLVLNARSDEHGNRIEYWLKLIQSLGGDSPVIVAINKSEQHVLDLDRKGLKEKYDNICDFMDISCETNKNIKEFIDLLSRELDGLAHVRDLLPLSWFNVKQKLEADTHDYLSFEDYEKICVAEGVNNKRSRSTLLGYLHDLGVVLNFRDDDRLTLSETNVLNPKWVTEGVYQLLNRNELMQSKGELKFSEMGKYLDATKYPYKKHHHFIVEMMEKFELCFPLDKGEKTYLIPGLLSKEEPDLNWKDGDCLAFEYHYDVLPGSIISRFITRNHLMASQRTYWRTGIVLKDRSNKALVKADLEDGKLFIRVNGTEKTLRDLLSFIRLDFEKIHRSIERLKVTAKVPIPGHPELEPLDYEWLLECEAAGDDLIRVKGLREKLPVQKLLDGIESRAERLERREEKKVSEMTQKNRTLKRRAEKRTPEPPVRNNPALGVLVYLTAFVVAVATLVAAIVVLNKYGVSWQTGAVISVVVIAAILVVGIVGALQLKNDDMLKDASFLKLMTESYRQLPLLRGRDGGNVLKD